MMRAYIVTGLFISCALLVKGHLSPRESICKLIPEDSPCQSSYIKIYLYTRKNAFEPQYIEFDDTYDNLTSSYFDPENPIKFVIHGYNADMNLGVLVNLRNQYMIQQDINIFVVDWSPLVANGCYVYAAINTKYCGKCIATLMNRINVFNGGVTDFHLIGFSLGAHTTSSAAIYYPHTISRITALDPALPLFLTNLFGIRITKDYALFVDAYHTNAFVQGQFLSIGHIDFFINGGYSQPGYPNSWGCDHHRAVEYFAESITTSVGFYGWHCNILKYVLHKCQSLPPYEMMGAYVDEKARGIYFVETSDKSPYAIGPPLSNKVLSMIELNHMAIPVNGFQITDLY